MTTMGCVRGVNIGFTRPKPWYMAGTYMAGTYMAGTYMAGTYMAETYIISYAINELVITI